MIIFLNPRSPRLLGDCVVMGGNYMPVILNEVKNLMESIS
jgi:hypothetical protein